MSTQQLTDKIIVITGSTKGIGRAIADECARLGATVVICSRGEESVSSAMNDLAAEGYPCCGMVADVSKFEDVQHLMEATLAHYGRIDGWVNNAGISTGYRYFDELAPDEIDRIVTINITGTMYGCKLLIPYFTEHGGILLNMSGRGDRGDAAPFTAAYASSKAAVSSLTKSLAKENEGAPISIHTIVPGMVDTDFYQDLEVSPRLESTGDNYKFALEAFGVSLEEVGVATAQVLAQQPGEMTGKTYSLLSRGRTIRGVAKMIWYKSSGKMSSS